MKHYLDIENLREFDVDIGGGMVRPSNCGAFELGDHIVITEKVDGSNASIAFNEETGDVESFSRKQKLSFNKTLNGFYEYASGISASVFPPGYIFFGEWTGQRNKIQYAPESTDRWYIFDIYNTEDPHWLPWDKVKKWCKDNGFDHVPELYDGEFKGWDHVRTFMNSPHLGEIQEGVVVKNQDKLVDKENRLPEYLKLVNDSFKESMIKKPKEVDPNVESAKLAAAGYAEQIVTRNRVEKLLLKMRDEGILPSVITPNDMGIVAKNLPKRVYEDCVKEEPEIVKMMGEYGGKAISSRTMYLAKEILL